MWNFSFWNSITRTYAFIRPNNFSSIMNVINARSLIQKIRAAKSGNALSGQQPIFILEPLGGASHYQEDVRVFNFVWYINDIVHVLAYVVISTYISWRKNMHVSSFYRICSVVGISQDIKLLSKICVVSASNFDLIQSRIVETLWLELAMLINDILLK